jgi:type IV pilus assembly protein PilC
MPEYKYTAKQQVGSLHKGTITAQNKAAAMATLQGRQLIPLVVQQTKRGGMNIDIKLPGSTGVKNRDLVIFTRQFSVMVSAGVPILRALTILKEQSDSNTFKQILEETTADVQGGKSLSEALAKHPKVFTAIYVNMVRAGEAGGILDKVLKRLAFQQEKDASLRSKIRSAMVYPIVIATVTLGAFFVLLTFIVPKIGSILTELSSTAELPIYTRALLTLSDTLKQPAVIVGAVVGLPVAFILFRRYIKTPSGRLHWHKLLLKVPIIKTLIIKTAIARFSRIFGSLMGAGVTIVSAIETTAGAIGNAVIEKELLNCSQAVQSGSQLSTELAKSKHFPPIVAQMLSVGEETGETDTVVLNIAEFYEEEVDASVAALSSVIEPVMIVVLGSMVGVIVMAVFGPITQISTSAE